MLRTLPCYFHPTTLLFVDDDRFLLESMQSSLESHFLIQKYTSAEEALKFIGLYQKNPIPLGIDLIIQYTEDFVIKEKRPALVRLENILGHFLNPKRFNAVSVTVVDFAMPGMTGVQFLEKINQFDCKKMMFTGEAGDIEGINLFNLNMIDRIYRKSEPAGVMSSILEDMQLQYFQEHSQLILHAMKNLSMIIPDCLKDPGLTAPVFELFKAKGIVEFYLINHEGLFITAKANGALELFSLQSETEKLSHHNQSETETLKTTDKIFHYCFEPLPQEQEIGLKDRICFNKA